MLVRDTEMYKSDLESNGMLQCCKRISAVCNDMQTKYCLQLNSNRKRTLCGRTKPHKPHNGSLMSLCINSLKKKELLPKANEM